MLKSGQEAKIYLIGKEFASNEHSRAIIGRVAFHARPYGKKATLLTGLRDVAAFIRLDKIVNTRSGPGQRKRRGI